MKQNKIIIPQIGTIHTKYDGTDKIPRQGKFSDKTESYIELDNRYTDGLLDLDGFSHAILVFHFHESKDWKLVQYPKRDDKPHGVFAIRSPLRPSGIGVTTVKLKSIDGNTIKFYGADMIDGTPLLDIKPYISAIDSYPDASKGWLEDIII